MYFLKGEKKKSFQLVHFLKIVSVMNIEETYA